MVLLIPLLVFLGACTDPKPNHNKPAPIQNPSPAVDNKPDWKRMYDEWKHPSPIPPFVLTDQNGKQFSLNRYVSDYVMVGFVFSRCPMPEACPLTMRIMKQTQDLWARSIKGKKDKGKKLNLLVLTIDPDFDTPDVLKRFGQSYGADFAQWTLATGPPELMQSALPSLFRVMVLPVGPGNIRHSVTIAVLKPGLKRLKDWSKNNVSAQEVIDLVLADSTGKERRK